jgi:CheY-like chemotaxis protein
MSHELRTPMNGILGLSEVLSDPGYELNTEEMHNIAGNLRNCAKRLMETLNQILDLSKLEAEKFDTIKTAVDLNSIVLEVISLFKENAARKSLMISYEINLENDLILSNERLLFQILNNLVDNAIKYTTIGEVKIIVGTILHDGNEFTQIIVKDTGIGIPEKKQSQIWEEFRQVSEGMERSFEGTGLGLTLTKKIVENLGGKINVISKENEGSSFIVELPLIHAESEQTDRETSSDAYTRKSPVHKTGLNSLPGILYIEDDEMSLEIVRRFLKDTASVEFASDEKQALKKLSSTYYDIILMDINLSKGMSGIEITHELRNIPEFAAIPVIALTAYAMSGDKEKILSNGFNDYLSKPFERNELIEKINKYL